MIPVSSDDVGRAAFARMLRDGALSYLAPRHGMPRDLPPTPADRAATLAPVVPPHTVVSGLAGLWVRDGSEAPATVDLVGRRGLHRAKPGADARGWRLAFHSGPAGYGGDDVVGGVRLAAPERCAADALRWGSGGVALATVYRAVRDGCVDAAAIDALVAADDPRGLGAARVRSAWEAVRSALASSGAFS